MADNATVGVNIGGANITTSGALTGTLLQDLEKFITAQHGFNFIQYTGQDVSGLGQQDVLVDLPPIDPVINLPDSAGAFMQDLAAGALTLTGGGANTSIAAGGSINYSGAAAEIVAVGAMGTVSSTGAGAVIGVGDGSYNVVGSGQGDTYEMDVGAGNVIDVTATGGGNLFEMDSISGAGPTDIATINALAGGNTWDLLSGNADATLGVADTVFATAGTSTINAAGSDVYYGGAASTMFLGAGGANTVFGGSGNDTVHGDGGVDVLRRIRRQHFLWRGRELDGLRRQRPRHDPHGIHGRPRLHAGQQRHDRRLQRQRHARGRHGRADRLRHQQRAPQSDRKPRPPA